MFPSLWVGTGMNRASVGGQTGRTPLQLLLGVYARVDADLEIGAQTEVDDRGPNTDS